MNENRITDLKKVEIGESTIGSIVNIMSLDGNRFKLVMSLDKFQNDNKLYHVVVDYGSLLYWVEKKRNGDKLKLTFCGLLSSNEIDWKVEEL